MEPILTAWEDYARRFWVGALPDIATLRNHAHGMLEALVKDMASPQNEGGRKAKSEGEDGGRHAGINKAAWGHAEARFVDGFDIVRMVAEFRALRASVTRIWWESAPVTHREQVEDMARFNEALDQLIATSISAFTQRLDGGRKLFLGILGHDMRQPLHSLSMFIEVMSMQRGLPAETGPLLSSMAECCTGMATMLSDLLDFTTSQLGNSMPVNPRETDFQSLCENVITEVEIANPGRVIFLESAGKSEGFWDPIRLRQLVSNLLSNAIHHGSSTDPIRCQLSGTEDGIQLCVQNMGESIPGESLKFLFDPMVRLAVDGKSKPHGSMGLGLYICRQIVSAHGGEISVESSETEGTRFFVTLPHTPRKPDQVIEKLQALHV